MGLLSGIVVFWKDGKNGPLSFEQRTNGRDLSMIIEIPSILIPNSNYLNEVWQLQTYGTVVDVIAMLGELAGSLALLPLLTCKSRIRSVLGQGAKRKHEESNSFTLGVSECDTIFGCSLSRKKASILLA